jgi:hypothetical protein
MGFPDSTRWFIIRVRTTSTGLEARAPARPHVKLELQAERQMWEKPEVQVYNIHTFDYLSQRI